MDMPPSEHNELSSEIYYKIFIEDGLRKLTDHFKDTEIARDKYISFSIEPAAAIAANCPDVIQNVLDRNTAMLEGANVSFSKNDPDGHTTVQVSFDMAPRDRAPYTLFSEIGQDAEATSWIYSPGIGDPIQKIDDLVTQEEIVGFIASIATRETHDQQTAFTREYLASPKRFLDYLRSPFAYAHLSEWFSADTLEVYNSKMVESYDMLTGNPYSLIFHYLNDDLISTELELWDDPAKATSHSVVINSLDEELADPVADDTPEGFYDFGAGPQSYSTKTHEEKAFAFYRNGAQEDFARNDLEEVAARLDTILQTEVPSTDSLEVPLIE